MVHGLQTEGVLTTRWPLRWGLPALAFAVDFLIMGLDGQTRFGFAVPTWLLVALTGAAYATLTVVGRPLLGYATLFLLGLGGLLIPSYELFSGFALALFQVARGTSAATARIALLGAIVPIVINTYNGVTYSEGTNSEKLVLAVSLVVIWTLMFGASWLGGRAVARGEERLAAERERAEARRADALRAERLRISRELHDIVGHSLTAIVLQAAGAARGLQTGTARQDQVNAALEAIQQSGAQSMRELHRLLGLIREETETVEVDQSGGRRTTTDLGELVAAGRAAGFAVEIVSLGQPEDLDPSVEHAVYRVVQEGLSNAMKYAEPGARVEIRRSWAPGRLEVTVTNPMAVSAVKVAEFRGGYGLLGLRERVHIIGGSVVTESQGGRFVLKATLPTTDVHQPSDAQRDHDGPDSADSRETA